MLNNLLQEAQVAVNEGVVNDMTEVTKGGGGGKIWPAGPVLARLVEVVELGNRAVSFEGQAKDPAPHIRLGFALFSANHSYDDGQPGLIRTFDMTISNNEKSKTHKLFKRMNYSGDKKHFAELLGMGYLLTITHKPGKKPTDKPYVNIDLDTISPPIDVMSQQHYQIPNAPDNYYRLFLWNKPTKAQWDSLIIKDADGKELTADKQWIQEDLVKALDFAGSPLEGLLFGTQTGIPAPGTVPAAAPTAPAAPAMAAPAPIPAGTVPAASVPAGPAAVPTAPAAPAAPAVPAPAAPALATPVPPAVPATPAPVAVPPAPAV
jgi:hypothetical protein